MKKQSSTDFSSMLDFVAEAIPDYRKIIFKTLILGLVIGRGRKCVSGIYRIFQALMLSNSISRKRFYCFLNSGKIRWKCIWRKVFQLLGEKIIHEGRLLVALDDTTYGKSGKKIYGCNHHYDHAAKLNSSKYMLGHCRVVIGIMQLVHGRWACLPIKQGLYRRLKDIAEEHFKTKIQIAGKLIRELTDITTLPVLIVTDSWFGNNSLWKEIKDMPVVPGILTRLRIDANLFAFPLPGDYKGRGRYPKYGKKLPKLPEYARKLKKEGKTTEVEMLVYGKKRKVQYAEFNAMHNGFQREVKVVIIYLSGDRIFPLVTTDLELTARQMIEYYSARWKIESGFKEIKHEIGAIDNQARKRNAVENHFELCCLATSMVWIYAMKQEKAPARRFPDSTRHFSFSDIRREIRKKYFGETNLNSICPEAVKSAGKLILDMIFRPAA